MYKKICAALIYVLCLAFLSGCFGEPAPTAIETAVATPPAVYVQLPEPYDALARQQLTEDGWQIYDTTEGCQLLIADAPQNSPLPQILLWDQPVDGAYIVSFDPNQIAASQISLLAQLPQAGDANRDGVITYAVISPTGSNYKQACETAMEQLDSKTECLSQQACKDDQAVAQQVAARILASYGKDLDVLLCGSQALSLGAGSAAKDAGRSTQKDLFLLTVGQEISVSSGTAYEDPQLLVAAIADLARQLSAGQTPPATTLLPPAAEIHS